MDTNINSNEGLKDIEEKLKEIRKIINKKIDDFHLTLKQWYEKQIKQKLNDLFLIVERSHEFLEEEKIKLFKT